MLKTLPLLLMPLGLIISCSDLAQNGAQLASEIDKNAPKAEQIAQKGKSAEQRGDIKTAAKLYDELALKHPSYTGAAELNYKAATLWESISKPEKAFESYQNYITTFRSGQNYQSALTRQSSIAFLAAKGGLSTKFLGLTQDPQYNNVVDMLSKVRDNAPASDLAAKAQFAIGTYSESKDKSNEAVAAYFKVLDNYPSHSLAPEATLRAGKALAGITQDGNQNSSNLQRAKSTLEDLIQQYPGSTQAAEARNLLSQISGTDVQRTYDIAEFYEKKGKFSSAKYYYQEVMDKSSAGSELHSKAQARLNAL